MFLQLVLQFALEKVDMGIKVSLDSVWGANQQDSGGRRCTDQGG